MRKDELQDKKIALLLDFDGTLVDIAPDPMKIEIDRSLIETLERLLALPHLPVAIITGRQIKVLDDFLGLPQIAVSGNHGTELRPPGSELVTYRAPPMPAEFNASVASLCKELGCLFESKRETAVVHAQNDAAFHVARNELKELTAKKFQDYVLWEIGLSIEIHRRSFSKVTGIQDMLAMKAFKNYSAVYIGDDVETYPNLGILAAKNVSMFHVGPEDGAAFHSPAAVRNFLRALVLRREGEANPLAALICDTS